MSAVPQQLAQGSRHRGQGQPLLPVSGLQFLSHNLKGRQAGEGALALAHPVHCSGRGGGEAGRCVEARRAGMPAGWAGGAGRQHGRARGLSQGHTRKHLLAQPSAREPPPPPPRDSPTMPNPNISKSKRTSPHVNTSGGMKSTVPLSWLVLCVWRSRSTVDRPAAVGRAGQGRAEQGWRDGAACGLGGVRATPLLCRHRSSALGGLSVVQQGGGQPCSRRRRQRTRDKSGGCAQSGGCPTNKDPAGSPWTLNVID